MGGWGVFKTNEVGQRGYKNSVFGRASSMDDPVQVFRGPIHKRCFKFDLKIIVTFLQDVFFQCFFLLKYIVTLFYKKLRIKIVVCLLCESGPRFNEAV